jgi:hypothetical protein
MGIIIADTLTLSTGQTVSNSYACFSKHTVQLEKTTTIGGVIQYECRGYASIFIDESSRNNNKGSIDVVSILVILSSSDLSNNLYSKLYTGLKTKYSSTSDVL